MTKKRIMSLACRVCQKSTSFECGGCKAFAYCGVDCQKQHWELSHAQVCDAWAEQKHENTSNFIGKPVRDISNFPKELLIPMLLDLLADVRYPEVTLANITRMRVNASKGDAGIFHSGGATALKRAIDSSDMAFALIDYVGAGKKKHMKVYVNDFLAAVDWPLEYKCFFDMVTLGREYVWEHEHQFFADKEAKIWPPTNAVFIMDDVQEFKDWIHCRVNPVFEKYIQRRKNLRTPVCWKMFLRLTRVGYFDLALSIPYVVGPLSNDKMDYNIAFTKCVMWNLRWPQEADKSLYEYISKFYKDKDVEEYVTKMCEALNFSKKVLNMPDSWRIMTRYMKWTQKFLGKYWQLSGVDLKVHVNPIYAVRFILVDTTIHPRNFEGSRNDAIKAMARMIPRRWLIHVICPELARDPAKKSTLDLIMDFLFTSQAFLEHTVIDILDEYTLTVDMFLQHASLHQLDIIRARAKNPQVRQAALMLYQSKRLRGGEGEEPPLKK